MQDNLLQQGMELMIFGMGTVFVFLLVLIAATTLMSFIVQRFFPEAVISALPKASGSIEPSSDSHSQDEQLLAVISAAVHKYRSRHKQ